jgi:hypothetical protein
VVDGAHAHAVDRGTAALHLHRPNSSRVQNTPSGARGGTRTASSSHGEPGDCSVFSPAREDGPDLGGRGLGRIQGSA